MAAPVGKKEIRRMPVRSYETVRDELRSGDLLFCSGSYLFSGLIQRFTGSVWSHVGVVYRDEALRRVFVLESETGIGVRLVPCPNTCATTTAATVPIAVRSWWAASLRAWTRSRCARRSAMAWTR